MASDKPKVTYLHGRYAGIFKVEGKTKISFGIDFYNHKRERRRPIIGNTLQQALKELNAIKGRLAEGRSIGYYATPNITFEQFVRDRFKPEILDCIENLHTKQNYITSLMPLLTMFARFPLSKITAPDIERYKQLRRHNQLPIPRTRPMRRTTPRGEIVWIERRQPHREQIQRGTINQDLIVLGRILSHAVQSELLAPELKPPIKKYPKEAREVHRTSTELGNLFGVARDSLVPIMALALLTGRRLSEILSLSPNLVKWEQKIAQFHRLKSRHKTILVPLTTTAIDILHNLPRPLTPTQPFFRVKRSTVEHWFKAAVHQAGLSDFHFHDLRHIVSSHLLNLGYPDQIRAEVLGHSSGPHAMTRSYSHTTLTYLRQVYDELEALLPPNLSQKLRQKRPIDHRN